MITINRSVSLSRALGQLQRSPAIFSPPVVVRPEAAGELANVDERDVPSTAGWAQAFEYPKTSLMFYCVGNCFRTVPLRIYSMIEVSGTRGE